MADLHLPHEVEPATPEILVADRQALLEQFAENPNDDSIWQTAYEWAAAEGDQDDRNGIAADIPVEELIDLADTVRSTHPSQRYDLMTDSASNAKTWFEVLETFTSEPVLRAKEAVIASWVNQTNPPTKFTRALDFGTGTGKSLALLETNAEQVVGVDRNAALLALAKDVAGPNTALIQADVDHLPIEDSSFDVAASSGLTGSLDRQTLSGFYSELARVLQTNGVYVELSPWPFDDYIDEQEARITATSKAMLADMIVDTVSGKHQVTDHLGSDEQAGLLEGLGLQMDYYDAPDADTGARYLLTVITKQAAQL